MTKVFLHFSKTGKCDSKQSHGVGLGVGRELHFTSPQSPTFGHMKYDISFMTACETITFKLTHENKSCSACQGWTCGCKNKKTKFTQHVLRINIGMTNYHFWAYTWKQVVVTMTVTSTDTDAFGSQLLSKIYFGTLLSTIHYDICEP